MDGRSVHLKILVTNKILESPAKNVIWNLGRGQISLQMLVHVVKAIEDLMMKLSTKERIKTKQNDNKVRTLCIAYIFIYYTKNSMTGGYAVNTRGGIRI